MADWFLYSGLYVLGIGVIPVISLLLVWWGLRGDRSKGRARCPKCWCDMGGTLPQLECPECGHDAGQERRLYRSRRGWRAIVLGVVLVLLSCYPLTIVGGWCREQVAVRNLTDCGHAVTASVRTGPDWLVGRLPERFARLFDRVEQVQLRRWGTDAEPAECGKLWHLQILWVARGAGLTDDGVAHLKGLSQLSYLRLSRTQVTDAGLAHLEGLSELQELDLSRTQVTEAGVAELQQALPDVQIERN